MAAMAMLAVACGGDDTREVDSTPSTTQPVVASSIPWEQSRDGLIQTLTNMGLTEEQAGCVVDRMDELDRKGIKPSDDDRTEIERLIQDCLPPG